MLQAHKNIFMVGIGGIVMFNMAIVLKKMGKNVSGSDAPDFYTTDVYLDQNNIPYVRSFDPRYLPKETDLVIFTGANQGSNNPQVIEAKKRGIKVMMKSEVDGEFTKMFKNSIAVCGCHGKTTTASLLAYLLKKLSVHPSYLIGTVTFNDSYGGDYDGKDYFVIEADEFAVNPPMDKTPKFMLLHPTNIICTNIDYDHPDIYANIEETKKAFLQFFQNTLQESKSNKLFLCSDDKNLMDLIPQLSKDRYVTYGFNPNADLIISHSVFTEAKTSFQLTYKSKNLGTFEMSLFGKHNIQNAAGVILALLSFGFELQEIKKVLAGFTGAKQRFEQLAYINDIYLFNDYGHQPTELKAVVEAARERFKNRRILMIFQPHTYSRTQALKNEFVEALLITDYSFIAPIFASAREKKEDFTISSEDLVEAAKIKGEDRLFYFNETNELITKLKQILRKGDVIFTQGAGKMHELKDDIIKVMEGCPI